MNGLFQYPRSTLFDKSVPKSKITARSRPTGVVREQLTDQVAQIIWKHKLFPKALNLPATDNVPEIEIFEVVLKGDDVSENVLKLIDKAVAFPIIFELHRAEQICVSASYKRPSGADGSKWVVSDYYRSDWVPFDAPRQPLPLALNLGALYREMLQALMPQVPFPGETMEAFSERVTMIAAKQKSCDKLKAQVDREKQFNRRVELDGQLKQAEEELAALRVPPEEAAGTELKTGART